jgi:asparagine synthase (glutamine-hydrolysing)
MVSDKMEMAHGVEGRIPFLDNALCELAIRLPMHLKINQGKEKYILRKALHPILPKWIYQRKKQPFAAPPANHAHHSLMSSVFNSPMLNENPFFKRQSLLSQLDSYPLQNEYKKVVTDSILLNVLSSCLLQDVFHLT